MTSPYRSRVLPGWYDPATAAHSLLADHPRSFWLDAGSSATAGWSYLGYGRLLIEVRDRGTRVRVSGADAADAEYPVAAGGAHARVEELLAQYELPAAEVPGFGGGWVGLLGYEYGASLVGVAPAPGPGDLPEAAWLRSERMLAFDHAARRVMLIERAGVPRDERWERGGTDRDAPPPPAPIASPEEAPPLSVSWRHSDAHYRDLVRGCIAAIGRGEAYQICLTNMATIPGRFDPRDLFHRLRALSPSHHAGLLILDGAALVSASPETFLIADGRGRVATRPIKGTRRRARGDAAEDRRLAAELLADEKERAENLMIVDLCRNDLTRVAAPGTVSVSELFTVESYAQVHQLVSTVEARLAPETGIGELIAAIFPAGSMTGAPKHRAMTLLAEYEEGPRGAYAGAFGYRDSRGTLSLAMVIRSIVCGPDLARIGAGGGITALSDPGRELAESHLKAAALLSVLRDSAAAGRTGPDK